jgi:prepilin peptidase CpaA
VSHVVPRRQTAAALLCRRLFARPGSVAATFPSSLAPKPVTDRTPFETTMNTLQAALLTVYPVLVIVAALSDVTSFTIPNRISVLLFVAFFPAALALGRQPAELGLDVVICLAALVAGMGMFAAGWIGGGDAKLFAAASLWLGWNALPAFLLITAIVGGGFAVLLLNARSSLLRPYLSTGPGWLVRLTTPGAEVPYGVAIAVGALAAFPQSSLMHAFHGYF